MTCHFVVEPAKQLRTAVSPQNGNHCGIESLSRLGWEVEFSSTNLTCRGLVREYLGSALE